MKIESKNRFALQVMQLYEKCLAEVESNPVYTSEESRERAFDDCIDKNGGDE